MPINKEVMASMVKTYGKEKGKKVYYATEKKKEKEGAIGDWMKKRNSDMKKKK